MSDSWWFIYIYIFLPHFSHYPLPFHSNLALSGLGRLSFHKKSGVMLQNLSQSMPQRANLRAHASHSCLVGACTLVETPFFLACDTSLVDFILLVDICIITPEFYIFSDLLDDHVLSVSRTLPLFLVCLSQPALLPRCFRLLLDAVLAPPPPLSYLFSARFRL